MASLTLEDLVAEFEAWEDETADAQALAIRDRQYYDGEQWSADDVATLKERGQPVITINRIARKTNSILGEEVRKRIDPVARPVTAQHEDAARAATDALRHIDDTAGFDALCGLVFADAVIEGAGAALVCVKDTERGDVGLEHVPWDRFYYDPKSRRPDFSDAVYLGQVLWMDLEDAIAEFPDHKADLEGAVTDGYASRDTTEDRPRKWSDSRRARVKICEHYRRVGKDWHRAFFTQGALLRELEPTGYMDERGERHVCPLIPVSCYVSRENQRYGVVRHMISPQDEINKRRSKLMHVLNVRQVIAERDMIREPQKFMTELARPDGFAETEPGALQGGAVQVNTGSDLGQGQMLLLSEAKGEIDNVGPNSAALAGISDAASGRALIARQQAASQELEPVFAAFRAWRKQMFLAMWQRVRQFWTEERWLRVTDDKELSGYRFVALNRRMSRAERFAELSGKGVAVSQALEMSAGSDSLAVMAGVQAVAQQLSSQGAQVGEQAIAQLIQQHPLMAGEVVANQVEQMLVDIAIDEAPDTAVIEQEEFDSLSKIAPAIIQARPDMAGQITEMLVRASSLRSKRELLEAMTKGPDKASQEQAQAMKALAAQMAQLQAALLQAQVGKTQADAQLATVRAQSEMLSAQVAAGSAPSDVQLTQAKAQREATASALEATKVVAEAQRDAATAEKHRVDAAVRAQGAMQPPVVVLPGGGGV